MKIGVTIHATDQAMPADELAVEAEERGFDSLYIPEHTHIPTSRRTPAPTGDGPSSRHMTGLPISVGHSPIHL